MDRLFRRTQVALVPLTSWPDGPAPAEVPILPDGMNPILRLADDWRLPRHETRKEVLARCGCLPDPIYEWPALVLTDAEPLPGALAPWTASAFERIPPQFPIIRFTALAWFKDDAHANLRRVADHLTASLGPAPVGQRWNTVAAAWRSGLAEVSLTAWPPDWQSHGLQNPSEDRDPRLRTACHVTLITGFRLALSAREREWVTGFLPLAFDGDVGTARMAQAGRLAPGETELEYVRDPEDLVKDRQRMLGLSADGEALIVVSDQLFVMPRTDILHLEVIRMTPAKGGGGSSLHAHCYTHAPGADSQSVFLAQHGDPDGMTALGQELGERLDCLVEVSPYYPDC
ncbi:hypothetical protein G8E10_18560 [Rhizobiaceae bacterium CRRU44]|uniref:Uncharacterized protein n=1 Tax=Ferranicluibacter rubi TaxID=2715133 RepID=A0AA43ZGZ3_9HYPH|nr:hypothetical protein [Ferranicluibacter rubi]NHT77710.1 hypothetical protein [Ferranicluibacter rubi]